MKKFIMRSLLIMVGFIGMMNLVGCPNDPGETRNPVPPQYQGTFENSGYETIISEYHINHVYDHNLIEEIWFVEPNRIYHKNGDNDEHLGTFYNANTFKNVLNDWSPFTRKTQ